MKVFDYWVQTEQGPRFYSINFEDLAAHYSKFTSLPDDSFMKALPHVLHFACLISFLRRLSPEETVGDAGIIHQLVHLMTDPDEPLNDLGEIRRLFVKSCNPRHLF